MAKCRQCGKRANYNLPNHHPRFCAKHKTAEMIDVLHKKCESSGCNKRPQFNFPEQPARFCRIHATSGMVDVCHKKCKKCEENIPKRKYDGLCAHCYATENPNVKTRLSKTEDRVLEFIKQAFPDTNFKFNKGVLGCRRVYRPDVFYEDDKKAVIVEIDEKQHKKRLPCYEKDYNQARDEEISKCLGKPLIIIRFNTHTYYVNGTIQHSPIRKNTQEIKNQIEWNARLDTLKKYLSDAITTTNLPEYFLVHWLYYDIEK